MAASDRGSTCDDTFALRLLAVNRHAAFGPSKPWQWVEWPLSSDRRRCSTRPVNVFHRYKPIAWVCLAAIPVSIVIAIGWFAAGHAKHGIAFLGLAVVAGIGAWFTTAPSRESAGR